MIVYVVQEDQSGFDLCIILRGIFDSKGKAVQYRKELQGKKIFPDVYYIEEWEVDKIYIDESNTDEYTKNHKVDCL